MRGGWAPRPCSSEPGLVEVLISERAKSTIDMKAKNLLSGLGLLGRESRVGSTSLHPESSEYI